MREKRTKIIFISYIIFFILACGSLFFATTRFENYTMSKSTIISDEWFYQGIRSDKLISFDDFLDRYPMEVGVEYVVRGTLPEAMKGSEAIYFYTRNAQVEVFVDGQEIYSLMPGSGERNTGRVGNLVALPHDSVGKEIVIKYSVKEDYRFEPISVVYYGSEGDLLRHVMCAKVLPVALGLLSFFIAIFQLGASVLLRKNRENSHQMAFLGFFSLFFSLWVLSGSNALELLSGYRYSGQNVRYYALSLVSYPILQFFLNDLKIKETVFDVILRYVAYGNFLLVMLLSGFNIMDLEQSVIFSHVILIVVCLRISGEIFDRWRKATSKGTYSGIALCFGVLAIVAMALVDMFRYYFTHGDSWIKASQIGYFVLIGLLTYRSLESAISMMNLGKQAETVQQLAYFDILTGVGNRTALNEAMEQLETRKEKVGNLGIVQFDVNGLKEVNDNLGHLAGDQLLKASAKVIKEGFEGYGECYRYGGDEFVVIIEGNAKEKYAFGIQKMENLIAKNNKYCPKQEKVSIAYGIAYYEGNEKLTMWQLQELADEQMYRRKRKMKEVMGK